MKKSLACLGALVTTSLLLVSCTMTYPRATFESPTEGAVASTPSPAGQPVNSAYHDFSALSYTEAFDKMFEIVRTEYAFNGIEGKQPDWEVVYAAVHPRVQQAEADRDARAWFLALRDFTLAFKDGHVNLGGGDIQASLFQTAIEGGYGFALRELDDGRVIVSYVTPGGPAESAGIQLGAQVTEFNGQPISSAIEATKAWGATPSMESSIRYQKARYLLRARVGSQAEVAFSNPGSPSQTVTLTAVAERESFAATSLFVSYNAGTLPVEFRILPSGIGYVRITSTADNRDQILSGFESALQQFQIANVSGLIIDLRVVVNLTPETGMPALGLASFLITAPIHLGQLQYPSASGVFENEGAPETVLQRAVYYSFPAMALLVGPGCARSCELEAYALSQVPGMIVVGQYPSAGVFSDITRGQFLLPEDFSLQIPTGRFVLPDGSLFLEGQGVPLTIRVPVDEVTVLSAEDAVLVAAEQALLK